MKRIDFSDSEARQAIATDIEHNLFVEASAGSGKTTSLVNRMVALVEHGVPIDKICTITFTIAAADEFFSRFQELLSRRMIDNPLDESVRDLGKTTPESRKRCEEALKNIDLCFTGTMDSFCNMVAHELPNELGIPSDATVISNEEKDRFIKEEYYSVLKNNSHPLFPLAGIFAKSFRNPYDAFSSGISQIFDYRGYEVVFDNDLLDSSSDHIIDAELNDLIKIRDTILKDGLDNVGDKARKELLSLLSIKYIDVLDWKNNVQKILYGIKTISDKVKFLDSVEGTNLEINYLYKPTTRSNYTFTPEVLDVIKRINETINEYLFQLFFHFVTQMRDDIIKKMRREGMFTFFDFLYYLRIKFEESCAGDRELIDHVYERHSHILIDESQDTNPIQTELFFFLTSTVRTNDWTKAKPKEGSLFIVGDPKQSIYGFRDADVKAFTKTKDIFKNEDEVVILSKNYRSNIVLKNWFNQMMNPVLNHGSEITEHPDIPLTASTDKEVEREIMESNPDITLNGVYKYETVSNRQKDAQILAEMIKKLVNNDNYKIISKKVPDKDNPARKIEYKDILIITREKKAEEYVECFSKENIPFTVEAKIFFKCSESFIALKQLLYLLFEPYKKQHLVNVLFSKLYKLNTEDIVQMEIDGFDLDISNLKKKDGTDVVFTNIKHQTIINQLHQLYIDIEGMSVSSTLFYLLTNNNYQLLDKCNPAFLEYSYFLIELIKSKENDGSIVSFNDAAKFIDLMLTNDSGIEKAMRFKPETNQVKISNLHKVKGLQAPIVILACPVVSTKDSSNYVDREDKKLYFSSIGVKNSYGNTDPVCKTIKNDNEIAKANESSLSEDCRLEYVAATRAESVLIIGHPDKLKSNQYNPWGHLLEDPNISNIPDYQSETHTVSTKEYDDVMSDYETIINNDCNIQSYGVKNPSGLRLKSLLSNDDEVEEEDGKTYDKALMGTMVHRLLECIVSSNNSYPLEELIDQIEREYVPIDFKYGNILAEVADRFINGGFEQIDSPVPENLFDVLKNAKQVMCELPFSYKSGENIISGVIDLLYEDENGWHVVDYKTNSENNINNLEEEYKIQLATYRKAFKDATGLDCDAHIFHIDV